MRISTHRRLTLAPGWSAPVPAGSGSRFSCLRADDGGEDSSTAETSEASRRRKTDEELAAEFWADIGYPTSASRVWERPSSRRGSAQKDCAQEVNGSPTSPAIHSRGSPPAACRHVRAPAISRPLVRPWIGPLPAPRVSPSRTLGDAMPSAGLARTAVITPTAPPMFPATGVSPDESGRSMGLGPHPISGASHPNRSLRMVNLNRWLFHMWNRSCHRRNPNLPLSFVDAVRSSAMSREAFAPPGSGSVQPTSAAMLRADRASSGGAPGFAPSVLAPVIPSQHQAHNTNMANMVPPPSQSACPVPVQPQQQFYQANHPHQYYQQQPVFHAPVGYMQNQSPAYMYQPAGPLPQQSLGPPCWRTTHCF